MTSFRGATQSIVSRFSSVFRDFSFILQRFLDIILFLLQSCLMRMDFSCASFVQRYQPSNFFRIFYDFLLQYKHSHICLHPSNWPGISKRSSLDDRFGVMRGSLFVMIVSGLLAINLVSLFLSVCLTGTGAWFQLRSVVSGFCREKVETQQQIC